MPPKLYKAAEVCEMVDLQPYVLRSWEKEFPGIGVQKSPESPRLYRPSDVDQVRQIRQLVFGEGLTLAGARRRLEAAGPPARTSDEEVAEVLEALASDARTRIAHVRDGLRSILKVLSSAPGTVVVVDDDFHLDPPPMVSEPAPKARAPQARAKAARRMATKTTRRKPGKTKRSRANA
jgi:DNA-binding transcriptional MerR regulator